MIKKLRLQESDLYCLALVLLSSISIYSQQGYPSNFSILGNVYSRLSADFSTVDELFQGPTANGIVDESDNATCQSINSPAITNQAFTIGSKYPQYEIVNGNIFYGAICCVTEANFTVVSSHSPGDFFPVGTTPVTYTATFNGCTLV